MSMSMSITERMQNPFPIEKLFKDSTYENFLTNFVRKHRKLTTGAFNTYLLAAITTAATTGIAAAVAITAGPVLGLGVGKLASISVGGSICTGLIGAGKFALLNLIVPPHYSMSEHVYTPRKYEGSELYYKDDVAVLSLDYTSHSKAGEAHGYLCGASINSLLWLSMITRTVLRLPKAGQLEKTLAGVCEKISPEYLEEMEGMVLGYNKWLQEQPSWKYHQKLTVNELLLNNLTPDSLHFQPKKIEDGLEESTPHLAVACAVIIDRDAEGGIAFARNMDWPSGSELGRSSFVIHRRYTDQDARHDTAEVAFPGLMGTLTGINDQGVCVAMNVCRGDTKTIRGMPALFYNRTCLEEKGSVQEIKEFTEKEGPLGSYHLNVADEKEAAAIHFYQSSDGGHVTRPYQNEEGPLVTLNHCYIPTVPDDEFVHNKERQEVVDEFCRERNGRPIEEALSLKYVNNRDTVHTVVMHPKSGLLKVAFDNSFAAENPLHSIDTTELFSRDEG